jgi:class 3 adenylate cyclase
VDDVAAWLKGLGLERYAPAFAAHDVDAALLPRLTGPDLEAIGVTSVGHRRKLLEAIAMLARPAPAPRRDGERRRLTVMFVDLVGSTRLSRQFDPEALHDVMRAYQTAVAGAIARLAGHLAKFLGDGVVAYFGWPHATRTRSTGRSAPASWSSTPSTGSSCRAASGWRRASASRPARS